MATQKDTARRAEVIADALGAPTLQMLDWRERMKEGVIVDLQIKRWRGRKRFDWLDVGIAFTQADVRAAYTALLTLGSKALLPPDMLGQLDSIERSARQLLEKYGVKTPFGLFLPYTTYAKWKAENEGWRIRYFGIRDDIRTRYGEITAGVLEQYRPVVGHAYDLLSTHAPEILQERNIADQDAFMTAFETATHSATPSATQIYDSFVYEVSLSRITLPDMLAPEYTDVTDEGVEAEIAEKEQERQSVAERERLLAEMNRDMVRQAQRQKEQLVETFFGSLMAQLRSLTYDAATDVLAAIRNQDGERLSGRSVVQLRNLVEQIRSLNFYADRDMDAMMVKVQAVVDQPPQSRDVREIERQLRAIALVTRQTLLELGETPRSGRELDVPDAPSAEDVREARSELEMLDVQMLHVADVERDERVADEDSVLASADATQREDRTALLG